MFGTFRYLLATLVVLAHLWPDAGIWIGTYAVFAFYTLSGYLMSLVLTRVYPPSRDGLARFFANRALRIYPPYLAVVGLTLGMLAIGPNLGRIFSPSLVLPPDAEGWLTNLIIFGSTVHVPSRLVPPAWSLHVELCFYVAMALGLGRGRKTALVWLTASVAGTAYMIAIGVQPWVRVFTVAAGALPFSLGAVLFQYRDVWSGVLRGRLPLAISAVLFLGNAFGARWLWGDLYGAGMYASMLYATAVIASLAGLDRRHAPPWLATLDRILGDLSYPIFLGHFCATIALAGLGAVAPHTGPTLFVAAFAATNLLAAALHYGVEGPVDRVRTRIRSRGRR